MKRTFFGEKDGKLNNQLEKKERKKQNSEWRPNVK